MEMREEEVDIGSFRGTWNSNPNRDSIAHRDKEAYKLFQHERPFIAWDGEGITYPTSKQQAYVLFACSTGDHITAAEGDNLGTERCFDLLFRVEQQYPNAYHVGFGFSYDVNQILSSLSRREIYLVARATKQGLTTKWNGYSIKIHPGKLFRVSRGEKSERQTVTIYDTFGFFQKAFIKVVASYFPDRLFEIESGKLNRINFQYADIKEITRYCLAENMLLVDIMNHLRNIFLDRGLELREWHGPGAVAAASFKLHNIKKHLGETPKEVHNASRLAYQGGRFELLRAGYHQGPIWQYDINSAYPSAIAELPSMSEGNWEFTKEFEPASFGVWNIKYRDCRNDGYDRYCQYRAQPFFYRDSRGAISYAPYVEGWYWTPEVEAAIATCKYPHILEIKGGWLFRPKTNTKPFAFIHDIYNERLKMKRRGDDGIVPKLEMNSYYGKFAQRAGWFKEGDRIPSYHQLEWAGYITSSTRAKLFKVYSSANASIFSFETDAIFSTRPIQVDVGENLGQWSVTEFTDILYLQSGFYFAHNSEGKVTEHYRGFDKGSLNFDQVLEWLSRLDPSKLTGKGNPKLYGPSKRFVGFKRALQSRNHKYWRTWTSDRREISIGRDGKRIHFPNCPLCLEGLRFSEGLHGLTISLPGGISHPHRIPWDTDYIENYWAEEKEVDTTDGFSD